ncbi:MAG: COX15/CtaA family protein [Micavibrio aeruginosavorus]|nr:COX15/CtaA family protein [Micavibrio aeruginosavorus]
MTSNRAISNWLLLCCFMVFAMAVIGAVTRLTESGLSITEWKPVAGALPPLNEAAWQHQFDLYKQTPEFAAKHFWMELGDFKKIFFWEWLHRLWGRSIGLVYGLPLLWFALRRRIPKGQGWKFLGLLALGGAQGFIGWFMVQSGLIDRPSVSHFRLALHLGMALLVFALMLWIALDFRRDLQRHGSRGPHIAFGWFVLAFLATTIVWGAFVAGLDAGMIYNTFPRMGAGLIPPDFGNPHSSPAGVQFTHRWLAITTFFMVMLYAFINRRDSIALLAGVMAVVQVGLGIATLLTQVNIALGAMHQAGAIVLLGIMLASQHRLMHKASSPAAS